jgi:hypothetical protein
MNYAESITFVFRQPGWPKKLLILLGLTLVPIVGWLMIGGYILAVTRNVIRGNQPTLPDWTDFGRLLADGLKVFVVVLVWSILPAIVDILTDVLDIPLLGILDTVVQIAASICIIAATGVLATTGNIADGLAISSIIGRVRATPRPYVTAAIASTVIAIAVVVVMIIPAIVLATLLIILLPWGFTFVISAAVAVLVYGCLGIAAAHLTGQAHRLAEGTALPAGPRF